MSDVNVLLDKLPAYKAEKTLVTRRQDTFDIIREIMKMHRVCLNKRSYDAICEDHWKGDPLSTGRELFTWAKRTLPYQEEKTLQQTVKEPQAILAERLTFGNDCKHYASYIVGVGEALRRKGYPVKCFYRFASYDPKKRSPAHVFAVMVIDGQEYWIDPVPQVGGFNSRNIVPVYYTDKMPPMSKNGSSIGSLYTVSGIPNSAMVSGHHRGHWLDKFIDSPLDPLHPGIYTPGMAEHMHRRHGHHSHHRVSGANWLDQYYGHGDYVGKANKHKGHAHHHIKLQPGKFLKKVGEAPSRNAFLLLLKLDAFHLTHNIEQKILHNAAAKAKLFNWWKRQGGNPNKLQTALTQGLKVWNQHHKAHALHGMNDIWDASYFYGDAMGVAPLAIPAAMAAAAPILVAIKDVLKSFGVGVPGKADIDAATEQSAKHHNDATADDGDGNADVKADGSVDHGEGVTSKVTTDPATGQQQISYDVKDPTAGAQRGEGAAPGSDGAKGGDDESDTDTDVVPHDGKPHSEEGGFGMMLHNVTAFVSSHKVSVGLTAAGAAGLLYSIGHKFPKKSSAPVLIGLASAAAIVGGGMGLLKK